MSTSSAHAAYDKKLNQEKQLHHDTTHQHQVPAEENHTESSADDVGWSFNIASLVDDCSSISSFGDESVIAVDDGSGIFHLESPDDGRSTRWNSAAAAVVNLRAVKKVSTLAVVRKEVEAKNGRR